MRALKGGSTPFRINVYEPLGIHSLPGWTGLKGKLLQRLLFIELDAQTGFFGYFEIALLLFSRLDKYFLKEGVWCTLIF